MKSDAPAAGGRGRGRRSFRSRAVCANESAAETANAARRGSEIRPRCGRCRGDSRIARKALSAQCAHWAPLPKGEARKKEPERVPFFIAGEQAPALRFFIKLISQLRTQRSGSELKRMKETAAMKLSWLLRKPRKRNKAGFFRRRPVPSWLRQPSGSRPHLRPTSGRRGGRTQRMHRSRPCRSAS